MFGETAGIQSACNSLYALCWVQIKQIFHWIKSDLDHILVEGDCLQKILGTLGMLSADQLPEFVKMFSHNNPVRYVRLETQLATLTFGDSSLRDIFGKMQIMLLLDMFDNIISGVQLYDKNITKSLIIFKKPKKMTSDFFNHSD